MNKPGSSVLAWPWLQFLPRSFEFLPWLHSVDYYLGYVIFNPILPEMFLVMVCITAVETKLTSVET